MLRHVLTCTHMCQLGGSSTFFKKRVATWNSFPQSRHFQRDAFFSRTKPPRAVFFELHLVQVAVLRGFKLKDASPSELSRSQREL